MHTFTCTHAQTHTNTHTPAEQHRRNESQARIETPHADAAHEAK